MNTRRKSSILPRMSITATKIGSTNVDIISFMTTEEKCVQEYKKKRKSVKILNDEHYRAKSWIITGSVDAATNTEKLEEDACAMASNYYNQAGKSNSRQSMKHSREGTSKQNIYESNTVRNGGSSQLEIVPVDELIQYKGQNKENKGKRKKVRILERPERDQRLPSALTRKNSISTRSDTNNQHNLQEVVINVERLNDETVRKETLVLNQKRGRKDKGKKTNINEGDDEKGSTSALTKVTNSKKIEKSAQNRKKRQPAKRLKKEKDESWSDVIPQGSKKRGSIRKIKARASSTSNSMPMNLKGIVKEEGRRESRATVKKESCDQKKVLHGKIKMESSVGLRRSQRLQASLSSMHYRK